MDRAHAEVEGVRTVYKWLLSTIGIATTVIFIVGIYFSYQSMSDFKAEIRQEGQKLQSKLIDESQSLGERLKLDFRKSLLDEIDSIRSNLNARVDQLADSVDARVEQEFQTKSISALIASNAAARVEEVADHLIGKEIDQRLTPRLVAAENRLKALDKEIGKARGTRDDLRERSEFAMTVIFAQNDDRKAFDELKTWSETPEFLFKNEAQQAWIKILDEHATPYSLSGFTVPWSEGVDPDKLAFVQLKENFSNAPPFIRVALLEYIWKKRDDIAKKDRMAFLAHVLETDGSLQVVEYAGRFFTQESKQKIKPLAVDVLLDWWRSNKADDEKAQPEN